MRTSQLLTATSSWRRIARAQAGVISRAQLTAAGFTSSAVRAAARTERWQRLLPGVYATFSGPVADKSRIWAAFLYAGEGAALGGEVAVWVALGGPGSREVAPREVLVLIPDRRRGRNQPGVSCKRRKDLDALTRTGGSWPRRLRIEEAVLDVTDEYSQAAPVIDVLLRATQRRVTTPARLVACLSTRPRHRWRSLVIEVLAQAGDGVQSPLEYRYVHGVERAHGLPAGIRNEREPDGSGGFVYRDVRYRGFRVVVELDGAEFHPGERAFRDRMRDNRLAVRGETTLRYGWREVVTDPCGIAGEVAAVLMAHGWEGPLTMCGPRCTAVPATERKL